MPKQRTPNLPVHETVLAGLWQTEDAIRASACGLDMHRLGCRRHDCPTCDLAEVLSHLARMLEGPLSDLEAMALPFPAKNARQLQAAQRQLEQARRDRDRTACQLWEKAVQFCKLKAS